MNEFEKALNEACQRAMDYSPNTDFGGEDNERLAALYAAKDAVLALHRKALEDAERLRKENSKLWGWFNSAEQQAARSKP